MKQFILGTVAGVIAWHVLRDHLGVRLPQGWGHISRVPAEDLAYGPARPAPVIPALPTSVDVAPGLQRINGLAFFR